MGKHQSINARAWPASEGFPPVGAPPGPHLGVVMLDTRFPRPPGDIGHPGAFGGRTRRLTVPGALPASVVCSAASLRGAGLLARFEAAVRELVAGGAAAITTSCGFLVLLQRELQAVAGVPVVTSSLLQLPALLEREPSVGVLTISATSLGDEHLLGAGVPADRLGDLVVQGVDPQGEFAAAIMGNRPEMDLTRASADVVAAAIQLKRRAPTLATVVLECTNMPPYADAVRAATGLRVLGLADSPVLLRALG